MNVWARLEELLQREPGLQAKTLVEWLQREYPGQDWQRQRRTVERRVRQWKAEHGPAKEVFFSQVHEPGRLGSSDFTHMESLNVTIQGSGLPTSGVPLRADVLQLGTREVMLFGELRQSERGLAKRRVGTGCGAGASPHRPHDAGRAS